MEFAIGFVIGVVIMGLRKISKSRKLQPLHNETAAQRKRRETDEVVTIILPTINNDK